MKSYVVIGLGRFGMAIAEELSRIGGEVLAIDESDERVALVADTVTHAIVADATDERVLRSIGVRNFDVCVVAIGENLEQAVLITLMLKELGAKQVVCKARDDVYRKVLERVGADRVVVPERDMGKRLAQALDNHNIIDYIALSKDYSIVEINVPVDWVGKTIAQINVRVRYDVTLLAIRGAEDRFTVSPTADFMFSHQDIIVAVGANDAIERLRGKL